MRFTSASIPGIRLIDLDPHEDKRGYFARGFCQREFEAQGLPGHFVQCNVSWNNERGILRGMHFQRAPRAESKVVWCLCGEIYDAVVDLRPASPTYLKWEAFELGARKPQLLYIPEGCAHGFQTLAPAVGVFYFMSEFFHQEAQAGVRWNDPAFGIRWPIEDPFVSDQDRDWPDFKP